MPIKRLDANDLYLEEVAAARQQTVGEKWIAGLDLFELACEFAKAGIRGQNPDATEERVLEILRERFDLAREMESGM